MQNKITEIDSINDYLKLLNIFTFSIFDYIRINIKV